MVEALRSRLAPSGVALQREPPESTSLGFESTTERVVLTALYTVVESSAQELAE